MTVQHPNAWRALIAAAAMLFGATAANAQAKTYPAMAAIDAYLEPSESAEIALARTAAPAAIADSADVLAFDTNGYHKAVTGHNGFTCMVQRSWNGAFENPEFWNPKIRVPICFNPAASRSVLPVYLARTRVVLATRSLQRVREATGPDSVPDPIPGSFAIMMSPRGYLADAVGPAGPHTMVFLANVPDSTWGANLPGSPVGATPGDKPSITIFYLPARQWSDGTSIAPPPSKDHHSNPDAVSDSLGRGRDHDSSRLRR